MAALTQEQLQAEINLCPQSQAIRIASEAVRMSKLILITHRVQDFTGGDVVALADIITRGANDAAR
jgi:hypothetical protein